MTVLFGVASAAMQIEGAADSAGRTASIWDVFATLPGRIEDGSRGRSETLRIEIGASAGIALYPSDGSTSESLKRAADTALYRVKDEGRGTVRFFEAAMDEQLQARRRIEHELSGAIPRGELQLYYQPIVNGRTGEIETFTETGLAMKDGTHVDADVVVAATGFHLCVMGDIAFTIDGRALDWNDTVTWRGMMFTGVPNMVWVFGYLRASWTLRADMVSRFVCRLLDNMAARGAASVVPALRPEDHDMPLSSWIDTEDFNANYILRGQHKLPRRGDKREWQHSQDYWREKDEFPLLDLDDRALVYSAPRAGAIAAE